MKNNREYIYSFPNTSCTLRVIEHLKNKYKFYLVSVAVINLIDCWLIRLSLNKYTTDVLNKNLHAFLNEMGLAQTPNNEVLQALHSLDCGESPTVVMNRYRVAIVSHGKPETEEIEIFRDRIVERLGYCPQNMA